MESNDEKKEEISNNDQPQSSDKTKFSEISKKNDLNLEADLERTKEASIELFKTYMQCFRNKSTEQMINDPRFVGLKGSHKFWDTQPVPKVAKLIAEKSGPIEIKKIEEISKTPIKLPATFAWQDFDLSNENDIKELYILLAENYVEDDDGCFRFDYAIDFLRWALMPPNYYKDMYFGIRDINKGNILVGFISGIPVELKVEKQTIKATEVNFLCVHKKYRSFSMASVLVKEIVRRSNLKNFWQGVFTSGSLIPTPFSQTRYYHRSLNPKKLIESRFTYANPKISVATYEKLNQVPDKADIPEGYILRPSEERDIKQIRKLVVDYLSQFTIYQEYTKEEARHWFLHRPNIIEAYVIEKNGKITDFFCYYSLPSSILNNKNHKTLRAAYSYYFVNTSVTLTKLYEYALIQAKKNGYDVFNALDVMNNTEVFEALNFHGGDGYLNYYLYNWNLENKILRPSQIGFVLM